MVFRDEIGNEARPVARWHEHDRFSIQAVADIGSEADTIGWVLRCVSVAILVVLFHVVGVEPVRLSLGYQVSVLTRARLRRGMSIHGNIEEQRTGPYIIGDYAYAIIPPDNFGHIAVAGRF